MVRRNVLFLFAWLLILSFVAVKVESAELSLRLDGIADFLWWRVQAYKEVEIGEEFSVTFEFLPVGATLDVVYLNVTVYGDGFNFSSGSDSWALEPDTSNSWAASWTNTTMINGVKYEKTAYLTAVEDSGVYGKIEGVYYNGTESYSMYAHFDVARIYSTTYQDYQDLENDYNELNQSFLTLQEKYDSLEANLNNTQIMVYASVITTVVFIVTTIYFAVRKPETEAD
jgi:hypothetical protein